MAEVGNEKAKTPGALKPFAFAAALWALVGWASCKYFSPAGELQRNLVWLFGLWTLSLVDLAALGKTVQGLTLIAAGAGENHFAAVINTFSWGLIKLVCLGIFALVMIKGNPILGAGFFVGMGTLVAVPLVGGFFWSQRVLGVS